MFLKVSFLLVLPLMVAPRHHCQPGIFTSTCFFLKCIYSYKCGTRVRVGSHYADFEVFGGGGGAFRSEQMSRGD